MVLLQAFLLALLASLRLGRDTDLISNTIGNVIRLQPCMNVSEEESRHRVEQFRLRLYYGNGTNDYVAVPLNESTRLLNDQHFKNDSCTAIFAYGWLTQADNPYLAVHMQSYIALDYNAVMIEWSSVTLETNFPKVASMTANGASTALAKSIDDMVDADMDLCLLVGTSLGGQLVGAIGRKMQNRVRHIVGLDPGGPKFYPPIQCVPHISASDGECVEVIHTNGDGLGTLYESGTVDFYVNGGVSNQPGCQSENPFNILESLSYVGCSHSRAQLIWNEVLVSPHAFVGRMCDSWEGNCTDTTAIFGQCSNSTPGKYYLTTNAESPYGQGIDGARNSQ